MFRSHIIPQADDDGVECYGVGLVSTGQIVLLLGWDDESEPMILVHLGDALGDATVGQVHHLLRLPLSVPSHPHQQLLMWTLDQRNAHWLPGGEQQGRSLEECLLC